VIQITDDRAPNGRHLRIQHTYGWERCLLLLDPARGKERLMEIQQHDGVVVEAAGFQQGFAKRYWRRKRCHGREREAPGLRVRLPSLPSTIYRG
jgi:hypothetical protein